MFGLDKIFGGGGIFGKFFDSIGMSWMNNVLSLAVNFTTGNWLAAAKDVFELVSQFSNNSWQNRVSPYQPLGPFGNGSCFGTNALSGSRVGDIQERADRGATYSARQAIRTVSYTVENYTEANTNMRNAHRYARA